MNHRLELIWLVLALILYNTRAGPTFSLCFLWFIFWYLLHFISLPIFKVLSYLCYRQSDNSFANFINSINTTSDKTGSFYKLSNLRRLLRSQLYCITAVSCGFYLITNYYHSWPLDLLFKWNNLIEYIFCMAIGHWMVSIIEDETAGPEVISHLILRPNEDINIEYTSMMTGLLYHHVFTLFAYIWCLYTHTLSGLCVFGLLFEAPVLLINIREIYACFDYELQLPYKPISSSIYRIYCFSIIISFHLFRTLLCLLWPFSILKWRLQLATLPIYSQVVYHILGLLFGCVNTVLYTNYIIRYMSEDAARWGLIPLERLWARFKVSIADM